MNAHDLSAFPVPRDAATHGMSLRDYFAAQALAGIIRTITETGGILNEDRAAAYAYTFAESMLMARRSAR